MLILSGAPALSDFRLAKLLSPIRERLAGLERIDTRYVHFIDVARPLDAGESVVLESLLTNGPAAVAAEPRGELLLVVPRAGTVSPWSSKATDIAHVCGLASGRRIERGVAYYLAGTGPLAEADAGVVASLLHDRMTEEVLRDPVEAERLFRHAEPRPLATVRVLGRGRSALEAANAQLGLALSGDEIDYLSSQALALEVTAG